MLKIFNKHLLTLIGLVLSIGILISCKKNDNPNSGQVKLNSFGPTGAKHGDTLRFIGTNLNLVNEIDFTGGDSAVVQKSGFIQQTSDLILVIVPKAAENGYVKLKTSQGDIISKTKFNLDVVTTITSMATSAKPGDNITLKGNYLNWIDSITFGKNKVVKTFVSKSITELVVKVPQDAQTGPLLVNYGGTKPDVIQTDDTLHVALPAITGFSPNPVAHGDNLTIMGTNLDLTMGVLFKGQKVPVTSFVSKSSSQLVVKVPDTVNKGTITLVAYSLLTVESTQKLTFVGDLPELAPLAYAFYDDALVNNWQNWGWNSVIDFASTDNVRDGDKSISLNYTDQWGALKFANSNVSTAPYSELSFSIFGTSGTGGKKINITPSGGSTYTITIEEGKWVEYKVPLSDLGNPATITDLTFQCQAWTGKVYMDHIGLR